MRWKTVRPNGDEAFAFRIAFLPGAFALDGLYSGKSLSYRTQGERWTASVDGVTELDEEERKAMGLARDDGLFWRNYFGFLGGIPMCLRDPGVHIEPELSETEFDGRRVPSMRVSFDPELGTDRWTFYFEPDTAELIGCRFDREDPARDGETLFFEGLVPVAGLQLPARRRWTMNADGEFLGTDILEPALP